MAGGCSLGRLLNEFHFRVSESLSSRTAGCYKSDIESLLASGELDTKFRTTREYEGLVEIIDRRIKAMDRSRKQEGSTKNRKRCAVNAFFDFLSELVGIEVPIYEKFSTQERHVTTLTVREFERFMRTVPSKQFTCARDRAIYRLIFRTGIYQEQIVGIKYSDFVRTNGKITTLNVVIKGGKTREIALNRRVVRELEKYEALYQAAHPESPLKSKGTPYFRSKMNGQLSDRVVRLKFQTYADEAGLGVPLISLRYSYIARQLQNGVKRSELAESLVVTPGRIYVIEKCSLS